MITLDVELARDYKRGFNIHDPILVTTAWDLKSLMFGGNYTETATGFYHAWTGGVHQVFVKDQGCHKSTVTLFHEMTHVLQAERLGSFARFKVEHLRQAREAGVTALLTDGFEYGRRYNSIPYEIEANECAYALIADHRLPLCYHIKHPGKLLQSVLID